MQFKKYFYAFLPLLSFIMIIFGSSTMTGCSNEDPVYVEKKDTVYVVKKDTVYITKTETIISYKLPNDGNGSTADLAGKWSCHTDFTVNGVCTNFTGWDFINHGLPYGAEINANGEAQYFDLAEFSGYKIFDIAYDKKSQTIAMIQTNLPYKAVYCGKVEGNKIRGTWYDGSGNQGDFQWDKN